MTRIHHKAIDDGPHGRESLTIKTGAVAELDNPRPACAKCSASWTQRTGLAPARCLVERSLLVRDLASRTYRLVVHCHGAAELVELGEDFPANAAIAKVIAFRRK